MRIRALRSRAAWLAVALGAATLSLVGATATFSPDTYLKHVQYLASDELRGRGNGTKELEKAGDYIAHQMKSAGLRPGGVDGGWFQPFEIVTGLTIGHGNRLLVHANGQSVPFVLGASYYPLSTSGSESTPDGTTIEHAPLVFGGYGISSKPLKYDDYATIDVKGKAVLIFTHEPQESDPKSRFNGTQFTANATLLEKAMTARNHGALALLVVSDPTHDKDAGTYAGFAKDPQADGFGIPVLRIERARAEALLKTWGLDEDARQIDKDLTPRSRELAGASIDYAEHLAKTRHKVRNVIGVLPGSNPALAKEAVVIGAHYDHLGLGGRHSMSPELAGQIHNGADDNASGTAAVMEMARVAAASRARFPRTLVFMTFAGEELGLLGSSHFVNDPTIPLDRIVAMINLDMVGRAQGKVMVSGLEASPSIGPELDAAVKAADNLEVRRFQEGAGVGSSDDTSFNLKKIPTVGFFSGFHPDYHRPTDDWQKIDVKGAIQISSVALDLAARIAENPARPEYTAPAAPSHRGAANAEPGAGGYGPYFGSVPDFGESSSGMRMAEVRENSPAGKAGLRGGDVMVEFGGKPIKSLIDFTYALRERSPGDEVDVKVLRNGQPLTVKVLLTTRP